MKRSEMIKLLAESFYNHANPNGPANSDEEMFDLILADIERAGMLPPHTIVTGIKNELEGCIQNCQWEPE